MRMWISSLLTLSSAIAAPDPGPEAEPAQRPESSRRQVAYFSFDETDNPEVVPVNWFRTQEEPSIGRKRPGFPNWNKAEIDLDVHFAGNGSVRLPVRGGSTSLTLDRGVIPVFEGADYQVTMMVRTGGLKFARAVIEARFLDASGKTIDSTIVRSRPILTNGAWQEVSIDILGGATNVAFLQIEFLVLQADQLHTRGVVSPDLAGAAWFDELRVLQLPRIELSTAVAGNVLVAPALPKLEASVRDLTGEVLDVDLEVFDAMGKQVFQDRRPIPPGRSVTQFMPKLPGLGWYRSRVSVRRGKDSVGSADVDFVWVREPLAASGIDHARFGLVTDELHPAAMSGMTALASGLGVSQITLPAWASSIDKTNITKYIQNLGPVIDNLSGRGLSVGLSFPQVPEELALEAKVDPDRVWPVFELDPKIWQPWLDPFLDRFGQRVTFWRIGSIVAPQQGPIASLPSRAGRVRDSLSRLVPGPVVGVAFPGEFAPPDLGKSARAVTRVPMDVPSEAVSFLAGAGQSYVIPHINSNLSVQQRIDDLARRTVELWAAIGGDPTTTLSIENPWLITGNRRPEVSPSPEFAVFRTLVDHLAGMRVISRFPAGPGVRAFVLEPASGNGEGTIIAWNESAVPENAFLTGSFGQGTISIVDLFGNSHDATIDSLADPDLLVQPTPPLRIPLSSSPVFIEHIDLALVKFISSVRVDPPVLQATMRATEHAILFKNTWTSGLTTRLMIVRPGGGTNADGTADRSWTISPRLGRATLGSGEDARIPFMVGFGPGEEAGLKPFTIDFDLATDRQYGRIRVDTHVDLALDGIELTTQAFRSPGPGGPDVVIEASLTNETGRAMNAEITSFAPGMPRDRRTIPALESGSRATRRFVLKNVRPEMKGARVILSVTEEQQGVRLNKSVTLP